jgi:hypothetical protein
MSQHIEALLKELGEADSQFDLYPDARSTRRAISLV